MNGTGTAVALEVTTDAVPAGPGATDRAAAAAGIAPLRREVAESLLLLAIVGLTLGGYVGIVMTLVRVAQ